MKKGLRKIIAAVIAAAMMPVSGLMPQSYAAGGVNVVLNPADASPFNGGRFEGWGTSLCWWANRLGYSEKLTQQAADLFFSEEGLGLDIARYNLGGGDDPSHKHITRSDSKVPGYATGYDENGSIIYDWTVDENQRNIAKAALKANPDLYVEGFSNSPPYFMTNSGCSSGAVNSGSDNLKTTEYENFAKFIADATKHFKEEFGITFQSYSPMNEPDTTYWGANSPKQEGCHYDPGTSQSNMIVATRNALDAEGLNDVLVAGMDETSIDKTVSNLDKLTDNAKAALGRIDTHSYEGSKRAQLKAKAVEMGKTLWMSEVDKGGKGGTNAGNMSMGLNLADLILADMNGMQPAAWVMWDIIDKHKDSSFKTPDGTASEANNSLDQNGTLWGVGMADHDNEKIELTQKYYVFGQFTKYINPGDTIIASSNRTLAAYNKDTGAIKIVAVNTSGSAQNYTFDMSAFSEVGDTAQVIRTSGAYNGGEHWARLADVSVENKKLSYELPANSVTTFVIDNKDAVITKLDASAEKLDYSYTTSSMLNGCDRYFAVYDKNGALKAVTVNQTEGTISGDFSECTAKLMVWDGMSPKIEQADTQTADIKYVTISGAQFAVKGGTYTYTSQTSDSSSITWSVSDETLATITADGVLTTLKGGTVEVIATSETAGSNSISVVISDAPKIEVAADSVTGSASWNNVASTSAKTLVDGNFDTYFDGLNAGYAILDLGAPHNIAMLAYAPRKGYEYRMIDGQFFGSNDGESWTELYTVTAAPVSGSLTYVMENELRNEEESYRYVKYAIPSGKQSYNGKEEDYNCNLSEIEVYGEKDETIAYITISGADSVNINDTAQYSVSVVNASADDIVWSVSDETIATIDENGLLTGVGSGEVVVKASSASLGLTAAKTVTVQWAKLVPTDVSGSAPWNNDASHDASKAVDGNTSTYFDGLSNGYVLLDFGGNYSIQMLAYAPRSGHEKRMPGVSFMASKDGENWQTIYSVTSQPSSGMHYIEKSGLSNVEGETYRYVKCQGTNLCNIAEIEVYGEAAEMTDAEILAAEAEKVYVPSEVYGSMTLPTTLENGVTAVWQSNDTSAVTANGKVTRGDGDNEVILTAEFTKGTETLTKNYNVTVKAAPSGKTEENMAAYLFVHFVGTESDENCEQIYFSLSKDGTTWETINEGMPVLTSSVGEKGVRDPHIIRSPEGDKFFLIATDLSIYNRRGDSNKWSTCQTSGSKSIVIWESTDLVNWSEARLVQVAPDNAGCAWAPESIYDSENDRYMVFWASKTSTDNYALQRVYRSFTRDFISFTEPEVYIEGDVSNIDTSFIKHDGVYYRFTKNESQSSVIMEKSELLEGPFEEVSTYTINGTAGNTVTGYEGPTAYKINGENKWCLLLDYYSESQGYKPFITDDISSGVFTSGSDFAFDTTYRHGTVMPITQEEYDALAAKYTPAAETGDMIFSLDFDNEDASAPTLGAAAVNGEITYTDGYNGGKAAVLDGTDYIEINGANGSPLLTGLETFTVSFASKADNTSWWFYAAPNTTAQTYKSEKYIGVLDSGSKLTCERYNSNDIARPSAATGTYTSGEWKHVTVVHNKNSYSLYINGEKVSTVSSAVNIKDMLGDSPIAYIGKANWVSGEFASGAIDDFKVYNYAMGADDVKAAYDALAEK